MNGEAPPSSTRLDRAAAIVLCAGVIAVMLAALSFKVFELDRYFVPKELVMNIAAFSSAMILIARGTHERPDIVDALLIVFLLWSMVSGIFATNHWLAQRAIAVSLSSAVVFWTARNTAQGGLQRPLLVAAATATVIAAATSLTQAYGVESEWFTLARAPGGTLGNRN
ncbi:MAG TPA: hypothetical protein VF042_01655, partial [Gemmatimonadaceae bacterium]